MHRSEHIDPTWRGGEWIRALWESSWADDSHGLSHIFRGGWRHPWDSDLSGWLWYVIIHYFTQWPQIISYYIPIPMKIVYPNNPMLVIIFWIALIFLGGIAFYWTNPDIINCLQSYIPSYIFSWVIPEQTFIEFP